MTLLCYEASFCQIRLGKFMVAWKFGNFGCHKTHRNCLMTTKMIWLILRQWTFTAW